MILLGIGSTGSSNWKFLLRYTRADHLMPDYRLILVFVFFRRFLVDLLGFADARNRTYPSAKDSRDTKKAVTDKAAADSSAG